ncbi:MAG: hypothetical protein ACTHMM_05470 [Agriterribacter sp.]
MNKKITITEKQRQQFNMMLHTLRKISKDYMSSEKIQKNSDKMYGLDYAEALEMSYDNIQNEAAVSCKGVKPIILPEPAQAKPKNYPVGLK